MLTTHAAVEYANQRMYQANVELNRGDGNGMGTTLTGLWQATPGGPLVAFHVGDSRIYRWRGGALVQLTRDQTMYQEALDAGAQDYLPPRNLLLQAIGPGCDIAPELHFEQVEPGDVFLLCSDGLYGASDDARIAALLGALPATDLKTTCAQLIEMAKQDGSRDNITVVVVQCKP
jgi:protein phosphatase